MPDRYYTYNCQHFQIATGTVNSLKIEVAENPCRIVDAGEPRNLTDSTKPRDTLDTLDRLRKTLKRRYFTMIYGIGAGFDTL